MKQFAVILGVLAAVPAFAEAPCGGLTVANNVVAPGRPLKIAAALGPEENACAVAVAAELAKIPGLRAVTVAARVPDSQRLDGGALQVAKAWANALVAGGLPPSKVVAVAPLPGPGEAASVRIAYAEMKGARPVAVIAAASGAVTAGTDPQRLQPVRTGAQLAAYEHLQTDAGASAKIALADGSSIVLAPGTLIRIGAIELNDKLKRVVKVDLLKGKVEAQVTAGGAAAQFDIVTRSGVAGVRGTHFRLAAEGGGATTRLETLNGKVELRGEKGTVMVGKGHGASIDNANPPGAAVALLAAPSALQPQKGPVKAGTAAKWKEVGKAGQYLVEAASDAEFLLQRRTWHVAGPQWSIDPSLVGKKWYWRVTAVDGAGFSGQSSKVYEITVE